MERSTYLPYPTGESRDSRLWVDKLQSDFSVAALLLLLLFWDTNKPTRLLVKLISISFASTAAFYCKFKAREELSIELRRLSAIFLRADLKQTKMRRGRRKLSHWSGSPLNQFAPHGSDLYSLTNSRGQINRLWLTTNKPANERPNDRRRTVGSAESFD